MARNHVAIDALGLFGKPLDKGSRVSDFAFGLGQRLALLQGHQTTEVVLVFNHQFEPTTQLGATLFGGQRTPGRQRLVSGLDGATGFSSAHLRHGAENLVGRRIVDLDGLATVGISPGAIDVRLLAEQLRVFELHCGLLNSTARGGANGCVRVPRTRPPPDNTVADPDWRIEERPGGAFEISNES